MLQNFPYEVKYRTKTDWLRKRGRQRWRRLKTRRQALSTVAEIEMLRARMQVMSIELSEWRWKVGGAHYPLRGPEFMENVKEGVKQRGYECLPITDEDLAPARREP